MTTAHPLQHKVGKLKWKPLYDFLKRTNRLNDWDLLNATIYARAYRDFKFFVRYFFPHHCKLGFSQMHRDFFAAEREPARRGRREAIAAPRGNAKTTFKTLFKVLHAIAYGYERFILIMSHSAPEAEEKVVAILDELEGNERFRQVYGELAPARGQAVKGSRWGKKWFVTRNGVRVQAKSRGQQIRGVKQNADRPTLVICDDIESPEGVLTPEQRKKTRDWFYKDVLKVGPVDGSMNAFVIGTCLHTDSLLSDLLRAPGWESRRYQAILSFSAHPELWEEYKARYTNLSDPARLQTAQAFFEANRAEMLEGTEVLWSEGEPYEALMRMKIDEGDASFSSEKMNDPYDPELQIFRMELAKRFRVLWRGMDFAGVEWLDGSGKVVPRDKMVRLIAFHDPALGKEPGQHTEPDYAAIAVVAQDEDGYLYCLDAWIEKEVPSVQVERAFILHKKWGFSRLCLESNHFQKLLRQTYLDAMKKHGRRLFQVLGVQQHQNKMQRISTLEPEITNGYLWFADSINPRLLEQLKLFPTVNDDGPDALQGAVAQLKKPIPDNSVGAPVATGNDYYATFVSPQAPSCTSAKEHTSATETSATSGDTSGSGWSPTRYYEEDPNDLAGAVVVEGEGDSLYRLCFGSNPGYY